MKTTLTPIEARIIGCLIEKEITTPDQYPLSLNALTNACNQKSNREPILNLSEGAVQEALDGLKKRYLVSAGGGFGSRVTKYQHRFCNTEFGDLKLSKAEVAIICELLLRGPQTPGELRSRAERMCPLKDADQVEAVLADLMGREEPLVAKLAREPGKRESRFMHLLCGDLPPAMEIDDTPVVRRAFSPSDLDRLEQLEKEVAQLRAELDQLKRSLGE